jgi:hypothetical protein
MRTLASLATAFACAAVVAVAGGCNVAQGPIGANVAGISPNSSSRILPAMTRNRPAEIFNQILPYPQPCANGTGPCPTDFEVTFKGNLTADIPSNEPLNVHENAFCNPSGSGTCAPTVTYNASSNTTTLEWSGPVLYQNRASGAPGVHFGLMAGQNFKTNLKYLEASSMWTYASAPPANQPIVSINSKQPMASKGWKYAIVYVAGTTSRGGGAEYATWNEIAYVPKTGPDASELQPKILFANYGSQPIYVTSSGIVLDQPVPTDPECLKTPACKENLVLLGDLQEVNYPPPTYSGSPFIALTNPPPSVLKPRR